MDFQSLRVRLLLGAAAAVFAALALAWLAMTLLFERHLERRVEAELTREAMQLVADLALDAQGKPVATRVPVDSRFIEPASGFYWQVATRSGVLRSRSLWNERLPAPAAAESGRWNRRVVAGPFGQRLLVIERTVLPERSGAPVLVQVAQDEAAILTARGEFGQELALFLLLLWAVLSGAAWLQVQLGLRPLERVRRELEHLRHSPTERLRATHPSEIEPLTAEINALADARERDLTAARHRAADLAHGLKTPLAALAAQSRRARAAGATEAADGLDRAIAAASSAVESELARARAASLRQAAGRASCPALPVIDRIVGVVERTDFGSERIFEVEVPADLEVPLGPADLSELMGALIENAARFSRRRVRIKGDETAGAQLLVEDDGPGLGSGRAEDALARGGRLDETGPGHGFGLSIARELAEATGATLSMETSLLGGLGVRVAWRRESAGGTSHPA